MLRTGCDPDNIRSKQSLWIIGMDPDMRGVKHKIDYSIGPLLLCCWKRQNEMAASLIPAVERVYHRSIQEAEKTFLTSLESWCLFGRQQMYRNGCPTARFVTLLNSLSATWKSQKLFPTVWHNTGVLQPSISLYRRSLQGQSGAPTKHWVRPPANRPPRGISCSDFEKFLWNPSWNSWCWNLGEVTTILL